ncbi:hypothetical protein BJ138DRAFT_1155663 [Hygrophoropsis aurantiaca]|uniref:Uncharacterized protein n=1 Tax=Hygrophoropsis aurantiaca TaxID=72124 RepID=A0ACB8A873_9AGAM|nr:hypothetical protein BJ138DRAFT_1155663 [Hygrophoropsis aurantiaca]
MNMETGKHIPPIQSNYKPMRKIVGSPMLGVVIPRAAVSGVVDPLLERVIAQFTAKAETSNDTPIMGDYWLGNILIDGEEGPNGVKFSKKLWVIDWEMCRYENPAKDVVKIAGDCFFASCFQDAAVVNVDPFRVVVGMGVHWITWARPLGVPMRKSPFHSWSADSILPQLRLRFFIGISIICTYWARTSAT